MKEESEKELSTGKSIVLVGSIIVVIGLITFAGFMIGSGSAAESK